jgi:hypothetical protein
LVVAQPGGGQPGGVDVASVVVQPNMVSAVGDVLDVVVTMTNPSPVDVDLVAAIFLDDGTGQYQPAQPPGFDMPTPITLPAGLTQTQFQIFRNSDPLAAGSYAIGVGVQGGPMQGGFFTVA